MRKKIRLLLTLIGLFYGLEVAIAQTTWQLSGNTGTNPPTDFLGTTDKKSLILKTNNQEQVEIDTNGHVGIAITAPIYPLTVFTHQAVSGGSLNSGGNFNVGIMYEGLTAIGNQSTTNNAIFGSSFANKDILFVNNDGSSYTERARITSAGNVGIGLTAPASLFHSAGQIRTGVPLGGLGGASATTGSCLFYNSTNTNTVNIQSGNTSASYALTLPLAQGGTNTVLTNDGFGALSWTAAGTGTISGSCSSGPNYIPKMSSTTAITCSQIYDTGTNLGIGTTTPASKLDVEGGIAIGTNYSGTTAAPANGAIIEGNMGIGTSSPGSGTSLTVAKSMTIDGSIGILSNGVFSAPSGSGSVHYYRTTASLSGSNNTNHLWHYRAVQQATFGGTATNQYGFAVDNSLTGATNNYGFWGNIASGTNRWNIYITGTAANYFAGDIGVGTASPAARLHLYTGASSASANGNANDLVIESNEANGLTFLTATNDASSIRFGDSGNSSAGTIVYSHSNDAMTFQTSGSERMRISSSGNMGIGTTSPANKLDVEGGIAVGATYSGSSTAPTNGAIIEGKVGIGTASPSSSFILDVQGTGASGTINASGDIWGSTVNLGSDQIFKTDIDSLQNALATIKQLKPKSYYFDTLNFNGVGKFNFSPKKQYGFIAQEIETILPNLVSVATKPAIVDTSGNVLKPSYEYRALNYIGFIPILTKGIQELQQKNDSLLTKLTTDEATNNSLQEQVSELTANNTSLQNQVSQLTTNVTAMQDQLNQLLAAVNNCCSATRSMQIGSNDAESQTIQQMDVKLRDAQSLVLQQNVPNPFKEKTTINYTLPESYIKAQLLFYNSQGKLIQSVELTGSGEGQLNVFADDLTNGIYSYSLVIDGQIIATKKMIKSK